MRSLCLLFASLALAAGCGNTSKEPAATGGAGQSSAGTSSHGGDSGAGGAGVVAGSSSVAGSNESGAASSSGSSSGGASGGGASGGNEMGEGGAPSLVDCDTRKVNCEIATPTCGTFQVPRVEGSCYGECVKIERCACSEAAECPDSNQFTCWKKTHCGPYVN